MMANADLLKKLRALGFSLFETEEVQDANLILADVVKSNDLRLWEGFPVVLANSGEGGLLDYEKLTGYLKASERSDFTSLLVMSLALYKVLQLSFMWAAEFYDSLSDAEKKEHDELVEKLKNEEEFVVAGRRMSSERLKVAFENYFAYTRKELNDLLSVKKELELE